MSKSEVKVREFWIDPDSDDDDMSTFIAFRRHPRQGDLEWQESLVHVIERSYATRLEEENKKLREALWSLRNDMVNVHNLLLDFYSEDDVYPHHAEYAFFAAKKSLEKLSASKALSGETKEGV